MRIACILSPTRSPLRREWVTEYAHMCGLPILANYLARHGHQVAVVDYLVHEGSRHRELDQRAIQFAPELIVLGVMFRLEDAATYLTTLPDHLRAVPAVAVGTNALDYRNGLLRFPQISYIAPVEPEAPVAELAYCLSHNLATTRVKGLAQLIGEVPCFVPREAVPLEDVLQGYPLDHSRSAVTPHLAYVWASRGCWYRQCTFCTIGATSRMCQGSGWNPCDVGKLLADLLALCHSGVTDVHFLDAVFIGPGVAGQERAKAIARGLTEAGVKLHLHFDARADVIQSDTIGLLQQAGLGSVYLGVESCSQSILQRFRKGLTVADIETAVQTLRRAQIPFRVGWLLADPDCSLEEVYESVTTAGRLRLYEVLGVGGFGLPFGIGTILCEPHCHAGTPLYQRVIDQEGRPEPVDDEIPCHYVDARVTELLQSIRAPRAAILQRYRWLTSWATRRQERESTAPWQEARWRQQYLRALRVLAYTVLEDMIASRLGRRAGDAWPALIHRHDQYWLGTSFEERREESEDATRDDNR